MSKPVKTSVLGVGLSATVFHIPFILSLPGFFSLHSILERSATATHSVAREKYGSSGVKVVTSYDEVLNDAEVECVVIGTPNSTHYQFAKLALQAGKHVIIEKPLTPTSAEANELIALAASHNPPLVLAAYQNRRFDSDFLTLRRLLEQEQVFGDLSEFETRFDRWRPVLKGQTWKEEAGTGQGVVYDLGSHLIDQVLALFGFPETITAHIHNSRRLGPSDFDDSFTARLYYPSRSIPLTVTLSAGVLSLLDPEPRYVVKGTKASYVKFGVDPQEDQLRETPPMSITAPAFSVESESIHGVLSTLDQSGKIIKRTVPSERGNYRAWFQNVGEAIQLGDPNQLVVKPEHARDVIRVIELMYQSSKEGKTIQVSK